MPAELLLGQLSENSADDTVKEALRQAFVSVDSEYFKTVTDAIMSLLVLRQDPKIRPGDPTLQKLVGQASIGASATVAMLLGQRLFVAGCGDTRAVLCLRLPGTGEIKAVRLSVDHVLGNEDEELRLRQLGLDIAAAEPALSPPGYTRCLGFHRVKGGYKEEEALKGAKDEPVTAEPEIHGGIALEPSFQFLLIFTRSLSDCLSQLVSFDGDVALELCRLTLEQFAENSSATGVAQSVVDKIVRAHREQFAMEESAAAACSTREDISLLVRQFNARLAKKKSGAGASMLSSSSSSSAMMADRVVGVARAAEDTITSSSRPPQLRPTLSSTTTESSEVFAKSVKEVPVDENGRIKPYVDFSHFHREFKKYQECQRRQNGGAV